MSEKHLTTDSVEPPRVNGILRVYSMKMCPYAKRVRMVLKAKNLPHDIVNINLKNKPEWYSKINPKGLIPTLLDGDKTVIESLDIADYLDEKYPQQNPMYPADPAAKKWDQKVIKDFVVPATNALTKVQYNAENYEAKQALEELLVAAAPLEQELVKRGTKYFGGNANPGMIDYMLWPWAERSATIPKLLNVEKSAFLKENDIPKLRKWAKDMLQDPTCKELYTPPDILVEVTLARKTNNFDYAKFFNE